MSALGHDELPQNEELFRGIARLAQGTPQDYDTDKIQMGHKLYRAWQSGKASQESCRHVPNCHLNGQELLDAYFDAPVTSTSRTKRQANRRPVIRVPNIMNVFQELRNHPIMAPKDSMTRPACRRCEAKRSTCNMVIVNN